MFGIFNRIWNYFFNANESQILELDEALEILEEPDDNETESKVDEIPDNACFDRTGIVTYVDDQYGLIDGTLYFEASNLSTFQPGMAVSYLAYTVEGKTKVSRVMEVNEWNTPNEKTRQWIRRSCVGKVEAREGRVVVISPGNVRCDLNQVHSEFIPVVGDWVTMESLVELDENVSDLSGSILDVVKLIPLRPKIIEGTIRTFDSCGGTINDNVSFNLDACIPGYIPIVRDKVVAEVIESDQGKCVWRALKVLPSDDSRPKIVKLTNNVELTELLSDKENISITNNICLMLRGKGDTTIFIIEVHNTGSKAQNIIRVQMKEKNSQISLMTPNIEESVQVKPNQTLIFKFLAEAKFMGSTRELVIFNFGNFEIGRWIQIKVVIDVKDSKFSYSRGYKNEKSIMKNARHLFQNSTRDVISGQRPVKPPAFIVNKLPLFEIPQRISDFILAEMESCEYIGNISVETIAPCLKNDLNIRNYADRFHTLLYLEEIALQINMHRYDLDRTNFIQNGEFLMLEVKDLKERRPSIVIGDKIITWNPNDPKAPRLEGFVHKTGAKHLYVKFAPNFHAAYKNEDYAVEFHLARTNFRRYHQAVDLAARNLGKEFLFPTVVPCKKPQTEFYCEDENLNSPMLEVSTKPRSTYLKFAQAANKKTRNSLNLSQESKSNSENSSPEKEDKQSLNNSNSSSDKENKPYLQNLNGSNQLNGVALNLPGSSKRGLKLDWYDKSLNDFQREAVKNILIGKARPLPYLIFGPPGTGKTVTLIETILQLLRLVPHCRLMVVAPSNSAADLIALRLLDSGVLMPGDLVRMIAFRCVMEGTIPERLIPYCATGDLAREGSRDSKCSKQNGISIGMQASVLGRHRITVGTCMVVGSLYLMGFPRGHFTHIIIDEAGQATEPEILIPLSFLDINSAQAVLAGDPLQLGPCVFSVLSREYGLSESFFERLINRFPYVRDPVGFPATGGYDPRLVTRLIYNYRSLPELLSLPNMLFYNSELKSIISEVSSDEVKLLKQLTEVLPTRKRELPPAIIFNGVRGENLQTVDCPSWYNPTEAAQVFYYINDLYRMGLTSKDIGVITPYLKQGQMVRSLLIDAGLELPKIGSVEEFQGQEFNVVILSTVRSNESGAKMDAKFGLGFISSPRRLNVAITRSKSLLIIIGNPHLLITDNYWRSVLKYACEIGGYQGCDLPNFGA